MNKHPQGRIWQTCYFAIVLISICIASKGLQAQNIYKCGNSYSQTPCVGASTLNINDARTAAQKQQTDAATRTDAKLAQSLEKSRLAQEKMAGDRPPATQPTVPPAAPQSANNVVSKITPKRIRSKKYKPAAFIALVPGSDNKPVKKKPTRKKASAPG